MYGALDGHAFSYASQRVGAHHIGLAALTPAATFAIVYALLAFQIRYTEPLLCWTLVACMGALVGAVIYRAVRAFRRNWEKSGMPTWSIFCAILMVVAFSFACLVGSINYWNNAGQVSRIMSLSYYRGMNPATVTGTQVMDAGKITFVEGSQIDVTRAMAFKSVDSYCVAPIVLNPTAAAAANVTSPAQAQTQVYDLWAIGLNCCAADFHCGEYANPRARAGLRLVREDQAPYFRLAVQQAQAAYGMRVEQPTFFYWVQHPEAELDIWRAEAVKYYWEGVAAYCAFQVVATIFSLAVFRKMGIE